MNFVRNLFGKSQKEETALPSAETLEEAKKLFFEYSCNDFYMTRDGVDLSNYHITREQEAAWRDEFIADWRGKLSTEDMTAVRKLSDAYAVEAIPDLLAMVDQGDSYARVWIAHALRTISDHIYKDKDLKKQTRASSKKIAQSLLDGPVQITERHKIEIQRMGGSDPEGYINWFAKEILR